MKILVIFACTVIPISAYAVDSAQVSAAYARFNSACSIDVSRASQRQRNECLAAKQNVDAVSSQLNREIVSSIEAKDRERQRIQQEERWRQEVRRQGGW